MFSHFPRPVEAKKKKKRKTKKLGPLSFDLDDDGVDLVGLESAAPKKRKIVKNPNVDTDFLPDKEREQQEALERQRLRAEWEVEQERIKSTIIFIATDFADDGDSLSVFAGESVTVTYSYWDGSGHRREITVNFNPG